MTRLLEPGFLVVEALEPGFLVVEALEPGFLVVEALEPGFLVPDPLLISPDCLGQYTSKIARTASAPS